MFLIKLYYHTAALLKTACLSIIYGDRLYWGKKTTYRKGFSLIISKSGKIHIEKNCFFNNYCSIASNKSIFIGEGTIFGENVKIYDHNHCYMDSIKPIKEQGYASSPIVIGRHCWISSNVVILKGVTIGDNCVIGASCIVHKNVPSNSILINQQQIIMKKM